MPRYIGTCFRFYTQMRVEKKNKAFAYRVPIVDYNYLQCISPDLLIMVVKPLIASILIGLEATKIECSTASRQNPILNKIYI